NLQTPLEGISNEYGETLGVRVHLRTGDTPSAERQKAIRRPPHILLTTPESLYLLLTSPSGRGMLRGARACVIDEMHALLGNKRGAHLLLSLARLDALCGQPLQRIGLSATLKDTALAMRWLSPGPVVLAAPAVEKKITIEVKKPNGDGLLPEGTVWPEMARAVINQCEGCRTVIAFCEGRATAERLAYNVNKIQEGFARTHHGSLERGQRQEVEELLRAGQLRLLIATASMELGIDVGEVDKVIQIGPARAVSALVQRLGRAGHRPGETSEMVVFPREGFEALQCALLAGLARRGQLEPLAPPEGCHDLLAQHLVSMAVGDGYHEDDVMAILPRAYPFRNLTIDDVRATLATLAGDYEHAREVPVRPRLLYDRMRGTVTGDNYSRMLALSAGGTIPDRGYFAVKTESGVKLGELDEEMVFEARCGDQFMLGAFPWKILSIRHDDVVVAPGSRETAGVPFWKGEGGGRHIETGRAMGALLRGLAEDLRTGLLPQTLEAMGLDEGAAGDVRGVIERQLEATGVLPDDRTLLLEHFSNEAGEKQGLVHCVLGRRVNDPLALLCREAARRRGREISVITDDDGFLLFPKDGGEADPRWLYAFGEDEAAAVLEALLPATPAFGMTFRYNSAHALIMGVKDRSRHPLWVQRMRASETLNALAGSPGHPLLRETARECLEDVWDLAALKEVLAALRGGQIALREARTDEPSPLSITLRRSVVAENMYDYHPVGDATAAQSYLKLEGLAAGQLPPPKDLLEQAAFGSKAPENPDQLHSLLMAEGDLAAGEADVPAEWFERLAGQGRAAYIEPGLWVAAEHAGEYTAAFDGGDGEALGRILRRLLRYRGGQTPQTVSERYFLPEEQALPPLRSLLGEGRAVEIEGVFYHAQNVERARLAFRNRRRSEIETLPGGLYAQLLCARVRPNAPAAEQLERGLASLAGREFPAPQWESLLLPARVSGYHPGLLDTLLAQGAYCWRLREKNLAFFPRAELSDQPGEPPEGLPGPEKEILGALRARGACFAHSLPRGDPAAQTRGLLSLARQGLVTADSFAPVRYLVREKGMDALPAKRRTSARVNLKLAGRWEALCPPAQPGLPMQVDAAFGRYTLLCRETAREAGLPWAGALALLRTMEWQGTVRRGYFLRGFSGAQFVRAPELAAFTAALRSVRGESDIHWISAADPLQIAGRLLPHGEGRAFTCVAATAVGFHRGEVAALAERSGASFRCFEPALLRPALESYARAFKTGRIYPGKRKLQLAEFSPEAAEWLPIVGFRREMQYWVLDGGR
ncbi:MAG: DEAD/DEAH box helicase, partial [Oscillospiraceae bacterium]|nr:DEAD/DEAH box helicase [Oscillospiraceae bacterium]